MDSNFHEVPTEILNEEIDRRRAVIEFRTTQAEELLTSVAGDLGGVTTYGQPYRLVFMLHAMLATSLLFFGLLGAVLWINFPEQYQFLAQICGVMFFVGLVWCKRMSKEWKRVKKEFLHSHPEEAKLLGYKK